jgi:hypothetical protein
VLGALGALALRQMGEDLWKRRWAGIAVVLAAVLLMGTPWYAAAQTPAATQSSDQPPAQSVRVTEVGPPSMDLLVDRDTEGVYLTARLGLQLSPALEDVLFKGIPLHFVWRADTIQSRWYWTDRRVSEAVRTIRLAYQPLTRRWRVSYSVGGADGGDLQQALHQNLDTLAEALAASSRVLRWRIADSARLNPGTDYRLEFRYQLDLSLLPRPFQIGVANQGEWNILLQQTLPLPPAP